jgi:hypothetical protein
MAAVGGQPSDLVGHQMAVDLDPTMVAVGYCSQDSIPAAAVHL